MIHIKIVQKGLWLDFMRFDVKLPEMYKNEDEALVRAIFITSHTPFNVLVTFSLWGWVNVVC